MSIKIKITVDPPIGKEIKFGYRPETFFVKLPDNTYNGLLDMAYDQGKDFQTLFTEIMRRAASGSFTPEP